MTSPHRSVSPTQPNMPEDIHRTHEFLQHLDDPTVLVTTRRPVPFSTEQNQGDPRPVGLKNRSIEAFSEGASSRSFSDKKYAKTLGSDCFR